MSAKPIAVKWDLFAATVLPVDAPAVWKREMRRAFYAGAEAMRAVLLDAPDNDTEGFALCDAIEADIQTFAEALQRGDA